MFDKYELRASNCRLVSDKVLITGTYDKNEDVAIVEIYYCCRSDVADGIGIFGVIDSKFLQK